MNRKERRKRKKELNKLRKKPELEQKIGLFDKIPDNCLVCTKPFDKKNKEMVMTWSVVVREDKGLVRLYCPTCWDKAQAIIKEVENENKSKQSG